ncbi:phage portal protein [Cellulosimicrobium cellulans]|uniref:phage portal protein n=1 Tax=Cellulosimicrobium cellulans TaxID=1710 RepID=UPI001BABF589|nr:phage portal protein [Cellulosimicrobium cellulans]QUC01107.1 phage portal protein [Cellulosimicrobium cellulans]
MTVAGLMSWFTRSIPETQIPDRFAVQTPWAEGNLTANVLLADAFGITTEIATRQNAMSVPAVAKARNLITSTVAAAVWRAYKGDAEVATQPPFLYRTSGQVTPVHRMIWTVDDLLFYGWSLWAVTRGAGREILDAVRIPRARWDFDSMGRVLVDGELTQEGQVVLIPASNEGLLLTASETILGALTLEREWQKRIRNPIAVTELHNTDPNDPLTNEEGKELVASFNANRRTNDGVTMYTPANIEVRTHGEQVVDLFIAGRNAVAIDVARHTGLPALVLDTANINAANQNYSNKDTARNDLLDAIRNLYIAPIEARLSQDDVVPRGQSVRADLSAAISVPDTGTGAPKED